MKKLALLLALLLVITSIPALAKVNKTGLPITDEKSSFTLFMDDSGEADKLVWFPYMEEATNVHVDLQIAPQSGADRAPGRGAEHRRLCRGHCRLAAGPQGHP